MNPSRQVTTSLLQTLKNPTYLLISLGFSFFLFDVQYVMMASLPGYENDMCVMGAGLKLSNIAFAVTMSLLGGVFFSGFVKTLVNRSASLQAVSFSSIGILIASMTVFCAACTLPVISLFGLAFGLEFFSTYNIWFKIISMLLIGIGLYQIDQQIRGECERCVE